MEIPNPRRILVLSPPSSNVLQLLKGLTGSAPLPHEDSSTAGLTHSWTLTTPYYSTTLTIWLDEISSLPTWTREFSKPEAREVVDAVGAWVYVFPKPVTAADVAEIKAAMKAVRGVIGQGWEGTCVAVGTRQGVTTSVRLEGDAGWEDFCVEEGWEYVDAEVVGKGRNEYGEMSGVARLREVLETTEWEGDGDGDFGNEEGEFDLDGGWEGLAGEQAEMSFELLGMKTAIREGKELEPEEEDAQVEEMAKMMNRLMAIKDTTSGMPEHERKKFAAKAVNDVLKDI